MKKMLISTLESLTIAWPKSYRTMLVFPILRNGNYRADYITLDEALRSNDLEVTEISEKGSVPEIMVKNRSDRTVLILEGEELTGSKQNRILNTTVIIGEMESRKVPVSCVERGRWSYKSGRFSSSGNHYYSSGRAHTSGEVTESYKRTGSASANQTRVWDDISRTTQILHTSSGTQSMNDIYRDHNAELTRCRKAISPVHSQVGCAVLTDGEISGVDILGCETIFTSLYEKLLTGYALDALLQAKESPSHRKRSFHEFIRLMRHREKVRKFLGLVRDAQIDCYDSTSKGIDVRISSRKLSGHALIYQDHPVHVALFPRN